MSQIAVVSFLNLFLGQGGSFSSHGDDRRKRSRVDSRGSKDEPAVSAVRWTRLSCHETLNGVADRYCDLSIL